MRVTGKTGESLLAEELPPDQLPTLSEGSKHTITVNAYERNVRARDLCIQYWGNRCVVCGFDFQKVYGKLGENYIHVHHLVPIAEIGEKYEIDPVKDLRPICPNCHAMIHKTTPPLTISQLKEIFDNQKRASGSLK